MRIFIAHAKEEDFDRVDHVRQLARLAYPAAEIVSAHSYWQAHFARAGGWDNWINLVCGKEQQSVGGVVVALSSWRFDVFVATSVNVGRATAQMLERAINSGRSVLARDLNDDGVAYLCPVIALNRFGPRTWKNAATCILARSDKVTREDVMRVPPMPQPRAAMNDLAIEVKISNPAPPRQPRAPTVLKHPVLDVDWSAPQKASPLKPSDPNAPVDYSLFDED